MTDADLHALAERYGTPLYLYDLDALADRVGLLREALPEAEVRYAVKANPAGAVLKRLAELGVGAEAITEGELARAVRAGIPGERIVLGGPGQGPATRRRAREVGTTQVSLDSLGQWRAWRDEGAARARFLVRVHPRFDPDTHPHLATGATGSKFGLSLDAARAVAREVDAAGLLDGFHVHAGSMIRDPGVHDRIVRMLDPLFRAFPRARALNLGGGFAVPGFDPASLAEVVQPFVAKRDLRLLLEPGRWLVAEAGQLLTRVLWRKEEEPGHWICDAGMAQLLRPALYDAHHPIRVVQRGGAHLPDAVPPAPRAHGEVQGPLCENADRLGRDRDLVAGPGDLLSVGLAGAYGMSMASNYASELRPAEVALDRDEARLIRRRESVEDLWQLEVE
ncbi:MAG: diaminopimelate decarboxylase [Trueperaceae bacterium]